MRKQKRGVKKERVFSRSARLLLGQIVGFALAMVVAMVFLLFIILSAGCQITPDQIDEIIDLIPTPKPTPEATVTPTPAPTATPAPAGQYPTTGSQRLLVKPASDNTGNLVILLPARWNNSFKDAWIEANGKTYRDTGRRNINYDLDNPERNPLKNNNGYRRHLWYKQSGASIGNGTLVVELEDGTRRLNRNFGQRTEQEER